MDEFVALFTGFYTLRKIFTRACNSFIPYVKDPITDIAANMIRFKLDPALTVKGLIYFSEVPHIMLHYENMTVEQKEYLSNLMGGCNGGDLRVHGNAVHLFSNNAVGKSKARSVETMDVLICVCSCLLQTSSSSALSVTSRRVLCNLFLQRVGCVVHIPHQLLVSAYEWAHNSSANLGSPESIYHGVDTQGHDDDAKSPSGDSQCSSSAKGAVLSRTKKRSLVSLVVED